MAPGSNIILVRHSQAEHNVNLDHTILDAPLTELGKRQSAALPAKTVDLQNSIDLICTSPLKRTLQSTAIGWAPAVERLGIENVVCLPQAQECNANPCDVGSPREVLESLDEYRNFNLELLTPDWISKKGFYSAERPALAARARWVRQYLRDRPEQNILLVSHGDILRQITATANGPATCGWMNAEVRIFRFDPATVDGPDCFLYQDENIAAVPGYPRNSSVPLGGGPQA